MLSIVIPIHNEEPSILPLYDRLTTVLESMQKPYEIIAVDDASTDRSFDLLANLERDDGQTLAALSRRMLVTAGNLTGLVDRAVRDGVVERRPDPSDRRLSRVFLTARGRDLVQSLIPVHAAHVSELLSSLDATERRDLRRLLGRLRESLTARAARTTHRVPAARGPRREPREKR